MELVIELSKKGGENYKIWREQVSASELRQAKTLLLCQLLLERISTHDIAEEYLGLVNDDLPLDDPAIVASRFRSIIATQVRKAFARWIRLAAFVQVVCGPAPL